MRKFWGIFAFLGLCLISCNLEPEIKAIGLDNENLILIETDSIKLKLNLTPSSNKTPSLEYTSDDPYIAQITTDGVIKGINPGQTQVHIRLKTNSAVFVSCKVTVTELGTAENPYLIYSKEDLKKVRNWINDGKFYDRCYKLMNDLDFQNDSAWIPIALKKEINNNFFNGVFDGNGKVIRNIELDSTYTSSSSYSGFFGIVSEGTVKNLGIEWKKFNSNAKYVGGIIGELDYLGVIVNCHTSGFTISSTCKSNDSSIGGIVGRSVEGMIINCYSTSNILGSNYTGGIAGSTYYCVNNYSSGDIRATNLQPYASSVGGIAGSVLSQSSNNIALNKHIVCLSLLNSRINFLDYGRITGGNYTLASVTNNYASNDMVIKTGFTDSDLSVVNDYSDVKKHGSNLTSSPVEILNNYVNSNPIYRNIPLRHWKTTVGINNNLPVFE